MRDFNLLSKVMKTIISLIFFFSYIQVQAQWDLIHQDAEGIYFNDMYVYDEQNIFLLGGEILGSESYSFVLKSTDGGISWSESPHYVGDIFKSIYFTTLDTGFAVVQSNGLFLVYRSVDSGVNWSQISIVPPASGQTGSAVRIPIRFFNAQVGVLSYSGVTFKTTDGGANWVEVLEMSGGSYSSIDGSNYVAVGGAVFTINSIDMCETWNNLVFYEGSNHTSTVHLKDSNVAIGGVGVDGAEQFGYPYFNFAIFIRATFNGATNIVQHFPYTNRISSLFQWDDNVIYGGTFPISTFYTGMPPFGHFIKSIDGGENWFEQGVNGISANELGSINKVQCASENICFAYGGNKIYKTNNGGGALQDQIPTNVINVGTDDLIAQTNFSLYPNPSTNTIFISSPDLTPGCFVRVYNLSGQLVYELNELEQSERLAIATSNIGPPGMYVVQLHSPGKVMAVQKLVVAE
jgi:photosystem II stability/assembly factor-like uncharacterized protein